MDNLNNQQPNGLEGLGVINTNNASATIDSSSLTVEKYDTDVRKFSTDGNKFTSIESFYEYLQNYLNNTGIVSVSPVADEIKQQLNFSFIFYAQFNTMADNTSVENGFCIFACPSLENVKSIINLLQNSSVSNIPNKRVAIGYFNYDNNIKSMAKQVNLDLMGYQDILDLNNAIDSGDKKLPYMNIGNSFEIILAKQLNHKYSSMSTGQTSQYTQQLSGLGHNLGESFKEGFSQLKQSIFGLGKDLGLTKDQQSVQQQPCIDQQYQTSYEQTTPVNNCNCGNTDPNHVCTCNNTEINKSSVSLKKND